MVHDSGIVPLIYKTAEHESMNVVNMAFGDQVVQAQINYLKRTVNSILRYTKAMAGTDPRQVMAQPSLTELFTGFLSLLKVLKDNGSIPIVENVSFNWTEIPLPQDVVHNTAYPPNSYVLWDTSQSSSTMTYPGFAVNLRFTCDYNQLVNDPNCHPEIDGKNCVCDTQTNSNTFTSTTGYFYGPIPMNMVGIYSLMYDYFSNPDDLSVKIVSSVYDGTSFQMNDWTNSASNPLVWYCVQFGPYKGLATFTSTPFMMSGIPLDTQALNITECNSMRLRNTPQNVNNTIYSLYVVNENVVIPFYSNCTVENIVNGFFTKSIQSIGYLSQYPSGYSYSSPGSIPLPKNIDSRNLIDMFQYHFISKDCVINLEPEWVGMQYWFNAQTKVISSIPTGFKLNQFTINPVGELSSSLEFVYTSSWITTYTIKRSSQNKIITDEIDLLENDKLLFQVSPNRTFVIDESNSFYGEGNNGRDCIQKSDTYSYDLTSCIFQNNLVDYDANDYFKGIIKTSGIARFISKFNFKVSQANNEFTFSLTPKDDADFNFYFQPDGTICPRLVNRYSDVSGCSFTFWFNGTGTPQFNNLPLNFIDNHAVSNTNFGLYSLTIGNPPQDCMLVNCLFYAKYSSIKFEPPPFTIIAASDLALQTKVFSTIDTSMNGTLKNLKDVSKTANSLIPQFQKLSQRLSEINFNTSVLYPYQDFTKQRQHVLSMIDNISSIPLLVDFNPTLCNNGVFTGVECFFQNIGGIFITVGIIAGVIVGLYFICLKLGLGKMIMKKLFG